jgi:hypothetical protein
MTYTRIPVRVFYVNFKWIIFVDFSLFTENRARVTGANPRSSLKNQISSDYYKLDNAASILAKANYMHV